MQTLFGEVEDVNTKTLKINPKNQKVLSKNQQLFNKLSKRIETLEKDIIKESDKLSKLLEMQGKEINPLHIKVANSRMSLAMALEKATERNKFSKKQIEKITFTILQLCDDAFMFILPNEEQEAFYDRWADVSYKEELEESKSEAKNMFSDFMGNMFGMNVDMDEFDDSPEGFARLQQRLKEQFEKQQNEQQTHRKKTKKQIEKDQNSKAELEIKNKSIRSIYIALVKVLHPDTETDVVLKSEKEEVMKKVTSAYDQNDLSTLLKLEMEWVHKTAEHLEGLSEDKLKIYISALKQQVSELEREKFELYHNPRYQSVFELARLPEKYALHQISLQMTEFKNLNNNLMILISEVYQPNNKKQILDFVNQFCEEFEENDNDFLDYLNSRY
jgi:hypothetical protein